jgi:hypothetical protein
MDDKEKMKRLEELASKIIDKDGNAKLNIPEINFIDPILKNATESPVHLLIKKKPEDSNPIGFKLDEEK